MNAALSLAPSVNADAEAQQPLAPSLMSAADRRQAFPNVLSAYADSPFHIKDDTLKRGVCLIASADGDQALLLYAPTHIDIASPKALDYRSLLKRHGLNWEPVATDIREIEGYYEAQGVKKKHAHDRNSSIVNVAALDLAVRWLQRAEALGASEMTISTSGRYCDIFFQIGGEERYQTTLDREMGLAMTHAIYVGLCYLDMDGIGLDLKESQDASISYEAMQEHGIPGGRIGTHPAADEGLFVQIRILPSGSKPHPTLEEQGYYAPWIELILEMLEQGEGTVLTSGPMGSGKSTALMALAERLPEWCNVLTLEDPIEYRSSKRNIKQLKAGSDWVKEIQSMVRLMPHVLIPSEIRSQGSAYAAVELSATGVLVLSTIHTPEVFKIVDRLRGLGVDRSRLYDPMTMNGFMAQRLVRRLCPECKVSLAGNESALDAALRERMKRAGIHSTAGIFIKGPGCDSCKEKSPGRIAVADCLKPDLGTLELLEKQNGHIPARVRWLKAGGALSKARHLVEHVQAGLVDPRDGEAGMKEYIDADQRFIEKYSSFTGSFV